MSTENLKFVVGGDVSGMIAALTQSKKSLGDFKDQLVRFKTELEKSTDPQSIIRLQRAIDATEKKIKVLQGTAFSAGKGFDGLKKGADSSGQSLLNLGRIVQDAPFGFIGIANNINPLVESFGRLKQETGSTGAALKSLAGGLVGVGGLGLAFSALTAGLTLYALATRGGKSATTEADTATAAYTITLGSFGSTVDEVKDKIEAFKNSMKLIQQLGEINLRINVADDFQRSIISQKQAFIQTQEEIAELEKDVNTLFDNSNAAFAFLMANAGTEARELLKKFGDDVLKIPKAAISRLESKSDKEALEASIDATKALIEVQKKLSDAQNNLVLNTRTTAALREENARKEAKEAADKLKNTRKISDVLEEMREQIKFLNKEELTFGIDKSKERLAAFLGAIKELVTKFKLDPDSKLIKGLFDEAKIAKLGFTNPGEILKKGVQLAKDLKAGIDTFFKEADPVEINFKIKPLEKTEILPGVAALPAIDLSNLNDLDQAAKVAFIKANGITKAIQDGMEVSVEALRFPELTALFEDTKAKFGVGVADLQKFVVESLTAVFDGLGDVIAGQNIGDVFGSIFSSIFKSLGTHLQKLGVQALVATKIILAIRESLGTIKGLGAAVAAIIAGSLIKSLAGKIGQGFSEGGHVTGAGTSTSDSIPARLSHNEYVLKASTVKSIGVGTLDKVNKTGKLPFSVIKGGQSSVFNTVQETVNKVFNYNTSKVVNDNRVNNSNVSNLYNSKVYNSSKIIAFDLSKFGGNVNNTSNTSIENILKSTGRAFAGGVTNFSGGIALVGERGPEIVQLPRGTNVIPNNQIQGGGQLVEVNVSPRIKVDGNDIWVLFDRVDKSRRRSA